MQRRSCPAWAIRGNESQADGCEASAGDVTGSATPFHAPCTRGFFAGLPGTLSSRRDGSARISVSAHPLREQVSRLLGPAGPKRADVRVNRKPRCPMNVGSPTVGGGGAAGDRAAFLSSSLLAKAGFLSTRCTPWKLPKA